MKFINTEVWGFKNAFRGMRNPMNSWDKSDSKECVPCQHCCVCEDNHTGRCHGGFIIGDNDLKLAQSLIKGGTEHRKFLRQIFVSVDITAPLYWWKEFDTYKVGTTANSTSTMHKLTNQPITLECFEIDDYTSTLDVPLIGLNESLERCVNVIISTCEGLRQKYLETKDKRYWKELVRWLPESWLQMRTVTMNYENLRSMYKQRKNHKLNEWSGKDTPKSPTFLNLYFCSWVESLPYAEELILYGLED